MLFSFGGHRQDTRRSLSAPRWGTILAVTTTRPETPYRKRPAANDLGPSGRSTLARDAVVVAVIFLAILSIAHWSDAIETFATTVLGFPKLP